MTVTKDDFDKIWASQSPLTPYSFSESQYKEGWNFVGGTPPSRQMWDAFMQGADEKLKYLYQHEDVPVGFEYFTMNPNIPQGSLPLLGGEYSRETYADLWSWVQEQTGYLKTEAEWQALSTSNNGNVPFYSDGDGSTTFRVPSLHCWIKGSDGSAQLVGSYLAAGLPDIAGNFIASSTIGSPRDDGAFSTSIRGQYMVGGGNYGYNDTDFYFNASDSNSIYGNANTVQPESIVGLWLVKAYGVIVDTGSIDEQAYIDDRYNAMKQYVDDEIADVNNEIADVNAKIDTVSTAEMSLSPLGSGKMYFNKKGNICMATFDNFDSLPADSTNLINSIPQGFRPLINFMIKTPVPNNSYVLIQLKSDGEVGFYNYGSAMGAFPMYETLTYICAD